MPKNIYFILYVYNKHLHVYVAHVCMYVCMYKTCIYFVVLLILLWDNTPNLQRGLCYIHSAILPVCTTPAKRPQKKPPIWRVLIPATSTFSFIFVFDCPFSAEAGALLIGWIVFVGGATVDVRASTLPFTTSI